MTRRSGLSLIALAFFLLSLVGNAQAYSPLDLTGVSVQRGPAAVLAEGIDALPPGVASAATAQWCVSAAGVALTFFAVVSGINQCRRLFGRTPPINEEISGLREEFHDALGQCVTIEIFKVHTDGMDRRCFSIEQQIKEQVTATDKYLHAMRHEVKNELQALTLAGEQRREVLEQKIAEQGENTSERVGKVHARVDKISEQISGQGTVLNLIAGHLKIRMGGNS